VTVRGRGNGQEDIALPTARLSTIQEILMTILEFEPVTLQLLGLIEQEPQNPLKSGGEVEYTI
jgi:hypothetical protein